MKQLKKIKLILCIFKIVIIIKVAKFLIKKDINTLFRVQVRRTDKRSEAKFYNIEDYMAHVEQWYINYSLKFPGENYVKSVYLATDAPEIIHEARKK